jgi:hypothetical protein
MKQMVPVQNLKITEDRHMNNNYDFLDYMKQQNIKCGYGWYGLIMSVLVRTRSYNYGQTDGKIKFIHFKEKDGVLQIKTNGKEPYSLKNIFHKAMNASTGICEYCGCVGKLGKRAGGEYKTLCPRCGMKYRKKKLKKPSAGLFHFMKEQRIGCDYGWYGLIFPIIAKLKKHNEKHPIKRPDEIDFFNERQGKLEIIISGIPHYLEELIYNAQIASGNICEKCGCPGNPVIDCHNWKFSMCQDCLELHEKEFSDNKVICGEESIPEFLVELSALTREYEIKICEGSEGDGCPKISDMEDLGLEYQKLEFNWETGCYTLKGFDAVQEENERETEDW